MASLTRPVVAVSRVLSFAAFAMLASGAVFVSGCDGGKKEDKAKKEQPKSKARKDAEKGRDKISDAVAKAKDKKAKGDKAKGDKAKGDKAKAAEGGAAKDAAAPAAKADAAAAEGEPPKSLSGKTFRKGQLAPVGMTPEELIDYNTAQGDPRRGQFTLDTLKAAKPELFEGEGKLVAKFETTQGEFECVLFEDKAPNTVASFAGLATGVRESYDKKADKWEAKKFYDGILFHRVIDGFMIQTGDPTGSGSGGPGFHIADEFGKGLAHTKKGLLSMANRGKNTGSSQFFITVAKTPHLDGKHAIFGECEPEVPVKISKVKVNPGRGNRPFEQQKIESLEIVRKK